MSTNLNADGIQTEQELLLDRGPGVARNKYGLTYRDNNYIETEDTYENLAQLDLNFADDNIGNYTGSYKNVGYDSTNPATVDRYGNAYNTDNVYDLGRFDDILKRKGKKSRIAEDIYIDDDYNNCDRDNADMKFIKEYADQEFDNTFQIGRSRRKRMLNEIIHKYKT
jgi:hypothetical protein